MWTDMHFNNILLDFKDPWTVGLNLRVYLVRK